MQMDNLEQKPKDWLHNNCDLNIISCQGYSRRMTEIKLDVCKWLFKCYSSRSNSVVDARRIIELVGWECTCEI